MAEGLRRPRDAARATRPLTENEVRFLAGLLQPNPAPRSRRSWWSVPELITFQPGLFGDRSPQGLHETGASCVRKGLACKRKPGRLPVEYQITPAGRATIGNSQANPRSGGNADPYQAGECDGTRQPWLAGVARIPAMCPVCNATPRMLRVPGPGPGEDPLVPSHPDMVVWSGRVDINLWRQLRATRDQGGTRDD